MHCSLAFGSIGARANFVDMAIHHHTAAITLKDIRISASGVRREINSVLRVRIVDERECWTPFNRNANAIN